MRPSRQFPSGSSKSGGTVSLHARRLILNGGALGEHDGDVQAVEEHFRGCECVGVIAFGSLKGSSYVIGALKERMPRVPFAAVPTAEPREWLARADGLWVHAGNAFVLADQLHRGNLLPSIRNMVGRGVPYGGTSAGANVAAPTICTTNDMPILRAPRSLTALGLVPFQINPHFLDASTVPTGFRGETREERIREFLAINDVVVIGLREGTWLTVTDTTMRLEGANSAVLFERGRDPQLEMPGSNLSHLLTRHARFNVPQPDRASLL
jgi:dipeptidase E